MSVAEHLLIIGLLTLIGAFLSISEISLAAARKVKLRVLAEGGLVSAAGVLELQEKPGHFFTVIQIGQNAVGILAGVVGEAALSGYVSVLLEPYYSGPHLGAISFLIAFAGVTSLFVLFADLFPKRLGMLQAERIALLVLRPMRFLMWLFAPLVWLFNGMADGLFRLFKLPSTRTDDITSADIVAMASAGAEGGGVLKQEQQLISNVFELDARGVTSVMTQRDSIVYFTLDEPEAEIRGKIGSLPHGKYPVCQDAIDHVIGYVDSKDILPRILDGKPLALRVEPIVRNALVIPDTLSLFEALERFRDAKEDFALVVNEYALVVGLITLQDVMNTVMGELVSPHQEDMIVRRDDHSWLIDGSTPIEDVMHVLDIDDFEGFQNYETIAGFLMYALRKVPKRTDFVSYAGYKFEVVDIDHYRIDQVLVTRESSMPTAEVDG